MIPCSLALCVVFRVRRPRPARSEPYVRSASRHYAARRSLREKAHCATYGRDDQADTALTTQAQRRSSARNVNSVCWSRRVVPCRLSELERVRRRGALLFRRSGKTHPRPVCPTQPAAPACKTLDCHGSGAKTQSFNQLQFHTLSEPGRTHQRERSQNSMKLFVSSGRHLAPR